MIIKLDLPTDLINRIQHLVDEGRAPSLSLFARTALENQLLDESGGAETPARETHSDQKTEAARVLAPFRLPKDTKTPPIDLLPAPSFNEINEFNLASPRAALLWGQVNRLLPVKIALRFLLNEALNKEGHPVSFKRYRRECASAARLLAVLLRREDFRLGHEREALLSAGLPWNPKESSARARFRNHYLGYTRKDGVRTGALFALRFVNLSEREALDPKRGRVIGEATIGLTPEGLNWALLPNPILDGKRIEEETLPFSAEEREFYLQHLRDHCVGEGLAVKRMIGWILGGKRDPGSLDAAFRLSYREAFKERSFTATMVSTMRSGLLSRMREMGLVLSVKTGRRVRYEITPAGFAAQELLDPL